MPSGTTQNGWVMVEKSDRMWSTGEGNGKPLQYSCLENPMNSIKRQNDRILKEELPRSVGAQYATGDQWRNTSRKNEGMEPKKNNTQLWMWGKRLIEFCQENALVIGNTLFQQHKRRLYTWTSPDGQHQNQIDYILCSQRWRSSIQSAKTRPVADCGSDHESVLPNSDLTWRK